MSLRRATAADAQALAALHTLCFAETWSAGAMRDLLAMPGAYAFAVEAGAALLGFVLARVAAAESEVLSIGVHPSARRQGLGRRLLAEAAGEAVRLGAGEMFLEVAVDNPAGLRLYAGLGFCPAGRRQDYYDRGRDPAADALILRAGLPLATAGGSG